MLWKVAVNTLWTIGVEACLMVPIWAGGIALNFQERIRINRKVRSTYNRNIHGVTKLDTASKLWISKIQLRWMKRIRACNSKCLSRQSFELICQCSTAFETLSNYDYANTEVNKFKNKMRTYLVQFYAPILGNFNCHWELILAVADQWTSLKFLIRIVFLKL